MGEGFSAGMRKVKKKSDHGNGEIRSRVGETGIKKHQQYVDGGVK